jgi:choice-of-anchor B domain-containing protein
MGLLVAVGLADRTRGVPPSQAGQGVAPLTDEPVSVFSNPREVPRRVPVAPPVSVAAAGVTGADDCGDTVLTPVPVGPVGSPLTVTIFGDNSGASTADCGPLGGDLVWWESFEIDECATVTIDFCGTDPVARPSWTSLTPNCPCAGFWGADAFNRFGTCPEGNIALTFFGLPAGRWYYPLLSQPGLTVCTDTGAFCNDSSECNEGVPCTNAMHPYTMHITAEASLGSCCDHTAETCTEDVAEASCNGANETWVCGAPCCELECRDLVGPEYQSSNVELLSYLSMDDFATYAGTPGLPYHGNEQWGYTSPAGRKYAIMGFTTGTGFADVTEPRSPQIVGYVDGAGVDSPWRDMAIWAEHAYIVTDQTGVGLQIADLSSIDQASVSLVATSNLGVGFFTAHNIFANPDSGYAYLCGSNSPTDGLVALDLTSPTAPTIAGTWSDAYVHDVYVISHDDCPYAGRAGQPCEIAYTFSGGDGLFAVDVTDKGAMVTIDQEFYPTISYCHQGWLSEDGNTLFMGDEGDERVGNVSNTTTYVIDVQDPANLAFVPAQHFTGESCAIDHNLMVRGDRVYEANYTTGLRVFDISNLASISEVGFFDTHPENNARFFDGAWGTYASKDQRVVHISDTWRGLFTFCDEPTVPIASFTMSVADVEAGVLVDFDGNSSSHCDPAGCLTAYEWDFDYDGVTFDVDATGPTVQHAYATAGTSTPALRVTAGPCAAAAQDSTAGPGEIDIATLSILVESGAPDTPATCSNDFAAASNGTGGERLSRFGCVSAPEPPAAAGGSETAVRVTLRTLLNSNPADPDGASVCPPRSLLTSPPPSISQFEGQTRWLGAPVEIVDEALPTPANYIGAPLVCTAGEAAERDWSPAGLAASFGGDTDASRIYFYGSPVVPCSVYEVSHCSDPLNEATCSDPLLVFTSRMGDAWPPFAPSAGQPSFTDINTHVSKYKGIPFTPGDPPLGGAPEWHTLGKGNVVADYNVSVANRKVGFLDIGVAVEGYKGIPYKEPGPCNPGTALDDCGNACSTAP